MPFLATDDYPIAALFQVPVLSSRSHSPSPTKDFLALLNSALIWVSHALWAEERRGAAAYIRHSLQQGSAIEGV